MPGRRAAAFPDRPVAGVGRHGSIVPLPGTGVRHGSADPAPERFAARSAGPAGRASRGQVARWPRTAVTRRIRATDRDRAGVAQRSGRFGGHHVHRTRQRADARQHCGPDGRTRRRQGKVLGWPAARPAIAGSGTLVVAAQFSLILVCLLPVGPDCWLGPAAPARTRVPRAGGGRGGLGPAGPGRRHPGAPGPRAAQPPCAQRDLRRGSGTRCTPRCCWPASGVTLSTGRVLSLVCVPALVVVLHVKARLRGPAAQEKFGWQFAVYASRVPSMIPQPWRSHAR